MMTGRLMMPGVMMLIDFCILCRLAMLMMRAMGSTATMGQRKLSWRATTRPWMMSDALLMNTSPLRKSSAVSNLHLAVFVRREA